MSGDEGRQVVEARWPQEAMDGLCQPCGVIARQRKRNLGLCVRALVSSAGTPGGASQAAVLRAYLACEGPRVARSAFARWCEAPWAQGMAALADRALA